MNWEALRYGDGEIKLVQAYELQFGQASGEVVAYLSEITALQAIKSRQMAAACITTAYHLFKQ